MDQTQYLLHFHLPWFVSALHCVKLTKPFEKLVRPVACGGIAPSTAEGNDIKTSEQHMRANLFVTNVDKSVVASEFSSRGFCGPRAIPPLVLVAFTQSSLPCNLLPAF